MPATPFLIGVDLGTTNSAVAAVDTRKRDPRVEVFRIPQLTAPGIVEPRPVLPSFLYFPEPDEIARELTVEAAQAVQLSRLTLLEEPIAAFYAWIAERRATALEDDEIALVCDVGGGTTDFSLIRVRIEAEAPSFERLAIGDHL